VPPRPSSLRNATGHLRPRTYSDTMDGYNPTTGLPSQGAPAEAQISSSYQVQESLLTEFQVRVAEDMASIQYGLNCLTQQVAAVPSQVLEGLARAGAPEESGWLSWISVCNTCSLLLS
jgi:hypothetical protein